MACRLMSADPPLPADRLYGDQLTNFESANLMDRINIHRLSDKCPTPKLRSPFPQGVCSTICEKTSAMARTSEKPTPLQSL